LIQGVESLGSFFFWAKKCPALFQGAGLLQELNYQYNPTIIISNLGNLRPSPQS